jgi:hypothetical protein
MAPKISHPRLPSEVRPERRRRAYHFFFEIDDWRIFRSACERESVAPAKLMRKLALDWAAAHPAKSGAK